VGKDFFNETIDHGCGKFTLFGRVLAEMPENPAHQNVRSALIPVPPRLALETYVVNASFVTADPDDPNRNKPFFPFRSAYDPARHGITVEGQPAPRRRQSQSICVRVYRHCDDAGLRRGWVRALTSPYHALQPRRRAASR
jgi:hypothetical protein